MRPQATLAVVPAHSDPPAAATSGVWYAAYGSNLSTARLSRYLSEAIVAASSVENVWLVGTGRLRCGGKSRQWSGGVLFLDPEGGGTVLFRLYLLAMSDFAALWCGENHLDSADHGATVVSAMSALSLNVGAQVEGAPVSCVLDAPPGAKYDRLVKLGERDSLAVVTITTSQDHGQREPSAAYLATVGEGLQDSPTTESFRRRYLAALGGRDGSGVAR